VRYQNLEGPKWTFRLLPLLAWRLSRLLGIRTPRPALDPLPRVRPNGGSPLREEGSHLTWIGHATFVLRSGGATVVIDPNWAERVFMLRRLLPPGVALSDLPRVDLVTVSHSHYDHLDLATLAALHERFHPTFVVPAGNGKFLRESGIPEVIELGWWESHRQGDLLATLVPAHHWSRRTLWDTNRSLWGGFVYSTPGLTVYHAGDTGFSEAVFRRVRERFGEIDIAMLPIGSYDPIWFMRSQHVTPEQAGVAFKLLGARALVPMHYGTFDMTDEPLSEPPARLRAWFAASGLHLDRLWMLEVGETRSLEDVPR